MQGSKRGYQMTATITTNHAVCQRCGNNDILIHNGVPRPCLRCEWRTCTNPARLIEMLGDKADDVWLNMFGSECDRILNSRVQFTVRTNESAYEYWRTDAAWDNPDCTVKPIEACGIIRCLWPNPTIERERVECPECEGEGTMEYLVAEDDTAEFPCETCHGQKEIEAPIIDPQWLTDDVVGLARTIRGGGWSDPDEHGWIHTLKPRPELMPILGDALLYAGCDNDEVIEHCQCGFHVDGCWVVDSILSVV